MTRRLLGATFLTALALLSAPIARAQAQAYPKPGPEQTRLKVWAGKWTYEGTEMETPLGIKGEFKGRTTNRMVAGGFALEMHDVEKAGDWLTVMWYDAPTKTHQSKTFQPSGAVTLAQVTVAGNTWTALGEMRDTNGKVWKTRNTATFSPDGKTNHSRQEYSADDGRTWLPWWEARSRKVGK